MNVATIRSSALKAIYAYKFIVSPWLPASCRFLPTCSEYAFEAIERYGLFGGFLRATTRVLRCHPLHRGGLDALT